MKRHLVLESETDGGLLLSVIINCDHFVYAIQKESGNGCWVYTTISDTPIDVADTYEDIIDMIYEEEM